MDGFQEGTPVESLDEECDKSNEYGIHDARNNDQVDRCQVGEVQPRPEDTHDVDQRRRKEKDIQSEKDTKKDQIGCRPRGLRAWA